MSAQDELDMWKLNAGLFLINIEMADAEWRKRHQGHVCDCGWYDAGDGRWFCKHLIKARNENKEIKKMQVMHTLSSPYVRHSLSLGEVVEAFNSLD